MKKNKLFKKVNHMTYKSAFVTFIFSLPRSIKRTLQVTADIIAVVFSFWIAMALRTEGIMIQINHEQWITCFLVIPITILIFSKLGLYRAIVRFLPEKAVLHIALSAIASALSMFVISQTFSLGVPRSVPGIYFAIFFIFAGGVRHTMRLLYYSLKDKGKSPVAIFDAGLEGRHLLQAIQLSKNFQPALFVDDNEALNNTSIAGIVVTSLANAPSIIVKSNIKIALITNSKLKSERQRLFAKEMVKLGVQVRPVPSVADLLSGKSRISQLNNIELNELMRRSPVKADQNLMSLKIKNKSVLITGAGGTIGSELTRQVYNFKPKKLILFEQSEFALYSILEDLKNNNCNKITEILPILGSVTSQKNIFEVINNNTVQTIFHAAAYKHVPLVEQNVDISIQNNIKGTWNIANIAGKLGVETFVLISSDKAIRPTNIMGATKRVAELLVQDAAFVHEGTRYCSVRFGNVLGSSGSVIPKFKKQIQEGGPITITDPEITRYFMTIPEAAELVIQSSALASSGEIYVLDMGEPIKILELAKTMVALEGLKTYQNGTKKPSIDAIKIEFIGLRPGEKMYEELVRGKDLVSTSHPRIACELIEENVLAIQKKWLTEFWAILEKGNNVVIIDKLKDDIIGYQPTNNR